MLPQEWDRNQIKQKLDGLDREALCFVLFLFFPFFLKKLNKFSLFPNIHQMSFHAKQQSQRQNHRVQASHLKGTFLARAVLSSHCDGWCLLSWQEQLALREEPFPFPS